MKIKKFENFKSDDDKIILYRYFGSGYYNGSCYHPFDKTNSEWIDDKNKAIELYNNANIINFDKDDLLDVDFVWCLFQKVEIPIEIWKNSKIKDIDDYISTVYNDYIEDIAEKGLDIKGKLMKQNVFDSIIYFDYEKPIDIIYGNYPK